MGIPLFITKAMRMKLKELGFTDEMIGSIKPEDAHRVINENLSPNDIVFENIKSIFDKITINDLTSNLFMN